MSNYFSLVDLEDKKVYGLGSINCAVELLPIVAKRLEGKKLCFYGDESYPWGEDKYETFFENEDFGEPWGAEYFDAGEASRNEGEAIDISLTKELFREIQSKLEGKEVTGLYKEIENIVLNSQHQ